MGCASEGCAPGRKYLDGQMTLNGT